MAANIATKKSTVYAVGNDSFFFAITCIFYVPVFLQKYVFMFGL